MRYIETLLISPRYLSFASAYQWKTIIDDEGNNLNSISDIARNENISNSHATKIYRLNFMSPKIVEAIVNGTAPRDLAHLAK